MDLQSSLALQSRNRGRYSVLILSIFKFAHSRKHESFHLQWHWRKIRKGFKNLNKTNLVFFDFLLFPIFVPKTRCNGISAILAKVTGCYTWSNSSLTPFILINVYETYYLTHNSLIKPFVY